MTVLDHSCNELLVELVHKGQKVTGLLGKNLPGYHPFLFHLYSHPRLRATEVTNRHRAASDIAWTMPQALLPPQGQAISSRVSTGLLSVHTGRNEAEIGTLPM